MEFWRVENKEKDGPYIYSERWRECDHDYETGRPSPYDDHLLASNLYKKGFQDIVKDMIFGFTDEESLHRWFSDRELKNLKKFGYHIKKYRVNKKNVILGGHQAILLKKGVDKT